MVNRDLIFDLYPIRVDHGLLITRRRLCLRFIQNLGPEHQAQDVIDVSGLTQSLFEAFQSAHTPYTFLVVTGHLSVRVFIAAFSRIEGGLGVEGKKPSCSIVVLLRYVLRPEAQYLPQNAHCAHFTALPALFSSL